MNPIELIMRRRAVNAFILADPVKIQFQRENEPTISAAGGRVKSTTFTLLPQTARIVHNYRRYNNGVINTEAGFILKSSYLLLGFHTLDVKVDDMFTYGPNHWRITGIHPTRTESKLCSIDFLGERNHA